MGLTYDVVGATGEGEELIVDVCTKSTTVRRVMEKDFVEASLDETDAECIGDERTGGSETLVWVSLTLTVPCVVEE